MTDPLSEVVAMLRPRTVGAKLIGGSGAWAVRYSDFGQPSFCTVLSGSCRLAVDGHPPVNLEEGDFILLPTTPGFTLSSLEPAEPTFYDPKISPASTEEIRHGDPQGEADVRLLGGYFVFDAHDTNLLTTLLPSVVHVRGVEELSTLVRLVGREASGNRAGRELVLERLIEILLIHALRSIQGRHASPGLLRGLGDPRLGEAMRRIHQSPAQPWTVGELAQIAMLSRSAFFDRFTRTVGIPPMEYLSNWRMALAKELLRKRDLSLEEVAMRVGYNSASTFSSAFHRHVGLAPGRFARSH